MTSVVILGNSHAIALLEGADRLPEVQQQRLAFIRAPRVSVGRFTFADGRLGFDPGISLDHAEVCYFLGTIRTAGALPDASTGDTDANEHARPIARLSADLSATTDIFYVCGASPFDVRRLAVQGRALSEGVVREILTERYDRRYLLGRLVMSIRESLPEVRHHFVGAPLRALSSDITHPRHLGVVRRHREIVRTLGLPLFDSVFEPDESLLTNSLEGTRVEFLRDEPGVTDLVHMGANYGYEVLTRFVLPTVG